jgi:hypothetical protein
MYMCIYLINVCNFKRAITEVYVYLINAHIIVDIGEHCAYFASNIRDLLYQPTEPMVEEMHASITAWVCIYVYEFHIHMNFYCMGTYM